MKRQPVESAGVRSVGYDPGDEILEIEYANGGVYQYFDVPPQFHDLLMQAPSIGGFVNRIIKPLFRYRKVK